MLTRTRTLFAGILLVAIAIIVLSRLTATSALPETNTVTTPLPTITAQQVLVTIASSNTKQPWMEAAVNQFNQEKQQTAGGLEIVAHVQPVLSGSSQKAILAETLQPVVWSPGSASWVAQINDEWSRRSGKALTEACTPTIYTPFGIAIWRPMAEALGWPEKEIGWQTLVGLAADPKGWGRYGHPEWGKFLFGHSHPAYANSGLLAMASFVYGITGKTTTLTASDVYSAPVESALRTLEQNTARYGRSAPDLLKAMAQQGPNYLHAVTGYEAEVIRFNLEQADQLRFPLVFVFPSGGLFWGDHPYCVLSGAPWVTPEQQEAATIFRDYLLAASQQALAAQHYLRPLDGQLPTDSKLTLANGTQPAVNPRDITLLPDPDATLGAAITDLFLKTKRKATVLLVVDTSGSMEGERIRVATEATVGFLKRLDPQDQVGVLTFSSVVAPLGVPALVSKNGENLMKRVASLYANGSTVLFDAVCAAMQQMKELQADDQADGDNRLYAIVLLSDGADTASSASETQMFTTCLPAHAEAEGIKVFPIAFGEEANVDVLQRIAQSSGGRLFTAEPASLDDVYISISAEQ